MKQDKVINIMFWGMLIFYLFLMLNLLLMRVNMGYSRINLVPFKSIAQGINIYDSFQYHFVHIQVWANVLIFIPAGIYLMVLSKNNSMLKAFA